MSVTKQIQRLELHRETIQDLTESEAAGVAGGLMLQCGSHHQCPTKEAWCPKPSEWPICDDKVVLG